MVTDEEWADKEVECDELLTQTCHCETEELERQVKEERQILRNVLGMGSAEKSDCEKQLLKELKERETRIWVPKDDDEE